MVEAAREARGRRPHDMKGVVLKFPILCPSFSFLVATWWLCETISNMLANFFNLNALPVPLIRQVSFLVRWHWGLGHLKNCCCCCCYGLLHRIATSSSWRWPSGLGIPYLLGRSVWMVENSYPMSSHSIVEQFAKLFQRHLEAMGYICLNFRGLCKI